MEHGGEFGDDMALDDLSADAIDEGFMATWEGPMLGLSQKKKKNCWIEERTL